VEIQEARDKRQGTRYKTKVKRAASGHEGRDTRQEASDKKRGQDQDDKRRDKRPGTRAEGRDTRQETGEKRQETRDGRLGFLN